MKITRIPCPACGGNLAFDIETNDGICPYCQQQLIIERSGEITTITPLIESVRKATAQVRDELLFQRLSKELKILQLTRIEHRYFWGLVPLAAMFAFTIGLWMMVLVEMIVPGIILGTVFGVAAWIPTHRWWAARGQEFDDQIANLQQRIRELSSL